MTTLKTRRLPVKICIHPGGTTEVFYSAKPAATPSGSGARLPLSGGVGPAGLNHRLMNFHPSGMTETATN